MNSFAFEEPYALSSEDARARFLALIKDAPLVDRHQRQLFVVVQRRRAKLTDREQSKMGLLKVWVGQLAEHVGCSVPEMRLDLARKFLPTVRRLDHVTHDEVEVVMSLSDLSDESMPSLSSVLTQVQALAREFLGLELRSNREAPPDLRAPSHRELPPLTEEDEYGRFNR